MMGDSHSRLGARALAVSYLLLWIGVDMAGAQVAGRESDLDTQLVVMISGKLGSEQTFGAGIIVGREKNRLYIVTANHVVRRGQEEARDLQIRLKSLPQKLLKANLLKQVDSELDLAVLSVEGTNIGGIDLCALQMDRVRPTGVKRGDAVFPMGNPNGVPWVLPAVPDRVAQVVGDHVMVQSTVISIGHSGGGLLDESANIIGMITADQPPFGRVVKIGAILKIIQRWGYPVQLRVKLAGGAIPLHDAAYRGDARAIEKLLADTCRIDVNTRTDHDVTPLHFATKHADIIPILLNAGADVHAMDQDGDTPLNWAAESGQLKSTELLIRAGAKIDIPNKEKMTALHWAVQNRHPAIVRALILAGAEVNAVAIFTGSSVFEQDAPLQKAVKNGDVEIVRMLLKAGAKVNAAKDGSKTALGVAVRENNLELAKLLLAAGADANGVVDYPHQILLHYAAERGQAEILKLLLKAGARVNATDADERTPLHAAAHSKSVEGVKLLLAAGADVTATNKDGLTPLHIAVQYSTAEIVNALVAAGANVNARAGSSYDGTPLLLAAEHRAVEIAKVLIAARANVNEKSSDGYTPLYWAVGNENAELVTALLAAGAEAKQASRPDGRPLLARISNPEITKVLLAAGVDANSGEGSEYGTALHTAARDGHVAQMKLLVAKGARLDSTDYSHRTPLHYAVGGLSYHDKIDIEAVKLLLTMGVNVSATDRDGTTPLHYAVRSTEMEAAAAVRLLIEAKAEINAKDHKGNTPLHYLAARGGGKNPAAKEVAGLLIVNGADINATNHESKTPLAVAVNDKNITISKLLQSHGAKE